MYKHLALAAVFLSAGVSANAQEIRTGLSEAEAQAIISGCKTHALENGRSHAIAVYDAGGHPVAFLRMEGNTPGVGAFAMDKAKAASLWRFATSRMEEASKNTPGFANAPGVVTVAGGVPIFSADGRQFLGGAGASGEPPLEDEACVVAGIASAGLTHERKRD